MGKGTNVLDGVKITPLKLTQDFVTPDMEDVLDFYPVYRSYIEDIKNGTPLNIQGYMTWVCKQLELAECRPGRTADDWTRRYFEHFGVGHFKERVASDKINEMIAADKPAKIAPAVKGYDTPFERIAFMEIRITQNPYSVSNKVHQGEFRLLTLTVNVNGNTTSCQQGMRVSDMESVFDHLLERLGEAIKAQLKDPS